MEEANKKFSFSGYVVHKPYVIIPAFTSSLSGFCQAIFSKLLTDMKLDHDAKINTSGITTTVLLFQVMGSIIGHRINILWGPMPVLLLSDLLYLICSLILGSFPILWGLWIGVALSGMAAGLTFASAPMFCYESSPHHVRRGLMTVVDMSSSLGSSALYLMEAIDTPNNGIFIISSLIPLIQIAFLVIVRDSSYCYLMQGRKEVAEEGLRLIYPFEDVKKELDSLNNLITEEQIDLLTALSSKEFGIAVLGSITCQICAQWCGVTLVLHSKPKILKSTGFKKETEAWISLFLKFLAFMVSIIHVDKASLKNIFMISLSVLALDLLLISISLACEISSVASYVLIEAFILIYAPTLGNLPALVMSELYQENSKSLGCTTTAMARWSSHWLLTQSIKLEAKPKMFFVFSVISAVGVGAIHQFLPKTWVNPTLKPLKGETEQNNFDLAA